ncbi:ROK family protein [Fusobacterium sp.]|uniref:ROK family protein n=1 Tax=Fusobacterium sp. TaxID=68766 RepID=UPI0026138450|nr:ROK family protein [Fusobacterium sp.]
MKIKLDSLKKINSGLILSVLKNYNFTRVELQKHTGLAAGTLSNIMKELVNKNVIIEKEESENNCRGRKGTKLYLNYNYKYIIGIKVKRGTLIGTLNNLKGEIINKIVFTIPDKKPETIVKLIVETINSLKKDKEILGIGVAFPGQIDSKNGIITYSAFYGWKKVNLKSLLKEHLPYEIFIENDVRAMALSEKDYLNPEIKNILYINIDRGVSAGIIINNELLLGDNFIAGHIGHAFVENNGRICNCGKIGCLETIASNPKMLEDYLSLSKETNEKSQHFNYFIEKIKENDKNAIEILNHALYSLAIVIGNLSNTFNISTIIIGGEIIKCGDIVLKIFLKHMSYICLPYVIENLKIKKSTFNHSDNTIGAVYIVLNQFFNGNIL